MAYMPRAGSSSGRSSSGYWSLTTILVAVVAGVVAVMLGATFLRSHHYMHTVVTHEASRQFDEAMDWQIIFNVASKSKNHMEFYTKLKAGGLLVRQSAAPVIDDYQSTPAIMTTTGADKQKPQHLDLGLRQRLAAHSPLAHATASAAIIPGTQAQKAAQAAEEVEEEGDEEDGELDMSFAAPIDGGPPPMSLELAQLYAVNGTIMVTWANYALWDFVKSWARHVNALGMTNILAGAMDAQIGRALVQARINSFAMYDTTANHSGVGHQHLQWGGESFHKMGRQKINLARMFLGCGLNLLLVDVDVVILRNVMHYFDSIPEADILVSSDQLASTIKAGDEGLEIPAEAGAPMNIGIMYFRYNNQTLKFVNSWLDVINARPDYWDQLAFNDMARAGWDPAKKLHASNPRVFLGYNDTLYVGVLPVAMFSGGHTYYIQHLYEVQEVQPYAVHCTFQYGANVGKRNRMREAMIFEDEEEYYTGEQYVMGDIRMLPNMGVSDFSLLNYSLKKAYNVKGLGLQLQSVYPTIGLSLLFNRTMIMPKMACYCDRYWTPLDDCRVPGARQQRLPFLCPMDYVLDPIALTDDTSKLVVKWREHSFLENPRCPESVRRSRLTIYVNVKYKAPSEKYIVQDGGPVLLLPTGLSDVQLQKILEPYSKYKVWHFRDPAATFTEFSDPNVQQEYRARIDHLKPVTQPDEM